MRPSARSPVSGPRPRRWCVSTRPRPRRCRPSSPSTGSRSWSRGGSEPRSPRTSCSEDRTSTSSRSQTRRCWPCWPLAASDVGSSSRWTPRISPLTAASAISPSPRPRSQPPLRVAAPSCSAQTLMRSVSSRGSSVTARRSSRIGGRGVTRWPRSFATTTSCSCRRARAARRFLATQCSSQGCRSRARSPSRRDPVRACAS